MKKIIFTLTCIIAAAFFSTEPAHAQCAAGFNVYQDTSLGAPLHTYLGNNTCQGANFMGIDTINYTYTWTWGDGTSTTAPFPSHTYATNGNYTICLYMNANNPAGCSDTFCLNATINKNAAMAYITIINPYVVASAKDVSVNEFSIFPNPAADRLFIKGLKVEDHTVAIYSVEGKLIATPSVENNQFVSVSGLAKGNYMLKITSASHKASTLRFTKN